MKHRFHAWLMIASLGGMLLGPWSEANAALNSYLTLKGNKQGAIHGGAKVKGREGSLPIIAIDHEVVSPRDPASGIATGKRQHKPLTLTLPLDRSAAQLYEAMFTSEAFAEVALSVFAPDDRSAKAPLYTITLSNASISDIRIVTPEGGQPNMRVSFTYQKIAWTWKEGGMTAQDDWETPIAAAKPMPPPTPKPMPKPMPRQ